MRPFGAVFFGELAISTDCENGKILASAGGYGPSDSYAKFQEWLNDFNKQSGSRFAGQARCDANPHGGQRLEWCGGVDGKYVGFRIVRFARLPASGWNGASAAS